MWTAEEIQAAVQKLVRSSVSTPIDSLGVRRTDITFGDVQEAASGVFLLHQNAPFYVLFLASQRVGELLETQAETVAEVLLALDACGNIVSPISDLTSLSDAAAALQELEGAVGSRSSGFRDISSVPAFVRFQNNVNKFLSTGGSNVKKNGDIVQTPQEARLKLPSLLTTLKNQQAELVRRVELLSTGYDDYVSLDLPSLAASGVISRAQGVLSSRVEELTPMSPTDRLSVTRDLVLDLLTGKAVVEQYGTFVAKGSTLSVTGHGQDYADSSHPAEPAGIVATLPGPYAVTTGQDYLDLFLDGTFTAKVSSSASMITPNTAFYSLSIHDPGTDFVAEGVIAGDILYITSGSYSRSRWVVTSVATHDLVVSGVFAPTATETNQTYEIWPLPTLQVQAAGGLGATVRGVVSQDLSTVFGPFFIHDVGSYFSRTFTDDNTDFTVIVDGVTFHVNFDAFIGSALTADGVAAVINAQVVGANLIADGFYLQNKYSGHGDVTFEGGATMRMTLPVGQVFPSNIVLTTDFFFLTGGSQQTGEYQITAIDPGHTWIEGTRVGTTPATFASAPNVLIDVGNTRRLRLHSKNTPAALSGRSTITIPTDSLITPFCQTVGFFQGFTATARALTAKEVASNLNAVNPRFTAGTTIVELFAGTGRSSPFAPTLVSVFKFTGVSDVAYSAGTITIAAPGAEDAGVVVGDKVVLRSGPNPGSVWTVVTIDNETVTASGGSTTNATAVSFDIGLDLTGLAYGALVRITNGPNTGDFYVASLAAPFDITLQSALPISNLAGQALPFSAIVSSEYLTLASSDTTLASSILAKGPVAFLFFSGGEAQAHYKTAYFKLPSVPRELELGDRLQYFDTDYQNAAFDREIEGIDRTNNILTLGSALGPEDTASDWDFSETVPVPFARLRPAVHVDYTAFKTALEGWLALGPNQTLYFTNLNRFVNPLLVNENPTAADVGSAKAELNELAKILTVAFATTNSADPNTTLEHILGLYTVPVESTVDTLITSFLQKGADRAADLLLEGQFSAFFGLDVDESSYAGDLLKSTREVAREDLNIKKTNRSDVQSSRKIGEADSPDFEYDDSDIDPTPQVDPPTG